MGILDKLGNGLKTIGEKLEDGGKFVVDHVQTFGDDVCPKIDDPYNEPNQCSKDLTDTYQSKHSCSNVSLHSVAAEKFCDQFGELGEWDYQGFFTSINRVCQVSLHHPFTEGKFPCLQSVGVAAAVAGIGIMSDIGSFGLATPIVVGVDSAIIGAGVGTGVGVECKRRQFNGQALRCCLQDWDCSGKCFEDSSSKKPLRTCDPKYRGAARPACQDQLKNYCLDVGNSNPGDFRARWTTETSFEYDTAVDDPDNPGQKKKEKITFGGVPICEAMLYRNMYKNHDSIGCNYQAIPGILPDEEGFSWARDLMSDAFKRYINDGGNLLTPSPDPMLQKLEKICRESPGLCDPYLKSYCRNFPEDVVNANPLLAKWCGCHLGNDHYDRYVIDYGISKPCTPLCHLPGTIPAVGNDGVTALKCGQQVCMIDGLTIENINSRVGDVDITQVCSGCIDCSCTIVDNTISTLEAKIGKISIVNQCSAANHSGKNVFNTGSSSSSKCVKTLNSGNASVNTTTGAADGIGQAREFDCNLDEIPEDSSLSSANGGGTDNTTTSSEDTTFLGKSNSFGIIIIFSIAMLAIMLLMIIVLNL